MICKQLTDVTAALLKLSPAPSFQTISRAICNRCERLNTCPNLTLDQADHLLESQPSADLSRHFIELNRSATPS